MYAKGTPSFGGIDRNKIVGYFRIVFYPYFILTNMDLAVKRYFPKD